MTCAAKYWAIDHFKGSKDIAGRDDTMARFKENIGAAGLAGFVVLMPMTSLEAARLFDDGSLDLVYIDASHEEADVRADITAWLPKVRARGWLMGHDYDRSHPGVVAAVDAFRGVRDPLRFDTSGGRWPVWRWMC